MAWQEPLREEGPRCPQGRQARRQAGQARQQERQERKQQSNAQVHRVDHAQLDRDHDNDHRLLGPDRRFRRRLADDNDDGEHHSGGGQRYDYDGAHHYDGECHGYDDDDR